jgi:hypothetical protein
MIRLASYRLLNQLVSRHSERKVSFHPSDKDLSLETPVLNDSRKALPVGFLGREKSI